MAPLQVVGPTPQLGGHATHAPVAVAQDAVPTRSHSVANSAQLHGALSRILIARATHALLALHLRYNLRMKKRITRSAA